MHGVLIDRIVDADYYYYPSQLPVSIRSSLHRAAPRVRGKRRGASRLSPRSRRCRLMQEYAYVLGSVPCCADLEHANMVDAAAVRVSPTPRILLGVASLHLSLHTGV